MVKKTFKKTEKVIPFSEVIETYGGVLTGSRAYGVHNANSDYDYIVCDTTAVVLYKLVDTYKSAQILPISKACEQIDDGEVDEFEYGGLASFYVSMINEGKTELYNIISLNKEEFIMWVGATEMMKHAPKSILLNRKLRRYMFHNTVDIQKMLL